MKPCRPDCVRSAPSKNLLQAAAAKELAIKHLFEQVSLKRELHVAGTLLRRGIARVSIAEALAWVKSDPLFVRPDPDGRLLTTLQVRDAENKMIRLAAKGQGKRWEVIVDLSRTDVPDAAELRTIKSNFPRDFPLSLLSSTWRKLLGDSS